MNNPISGIIPELLAKKGYNEPCKYCVDNEFEKPMPYDCGMEMHQNSFGVYYSSPTIAQVVMWLYEKHGIWIQIHHWTKQPVNDDEILENAFQWFANGEADGKIFRTPTEAYLQAIEYTLKNLVNDTI